MYELMVYYSGDVIARRTVQVSGAAEALSLIPQLLALDGCEHIVVLASGVRLFAVDCAGDEFP